MKNVIIKTGNRKTTISKVAIRKAAEQAYGIPPAKDVKKPAKKAA